MRVGDVAKRLSVSVSTAYALISSGKLQSYRIGMGRGTYRVSEEQLSAYLKGAEPCPPTAPVPAHRPKLKHLRLP